MYTLIALARLQTRRSLTFHYCGESCWELHVPGIRPTEAPITRNYVYSPALVSSTGAIVCVWQVLRLPCQIRS